MVLTIPRIDKSTHTRVLFIGSFNFYNNYTLRR